MRSTRSLARWSARRPSWARGSIPACCGRSRRLPASWRRPWQGWKASAFSRRWTRRRAIDANERARSFYERLLELAASAPPEERDDAAVLAAECGLADLEALAGDFAAAIARLRQLLARGEDRLSPEARAAVRRRLGVAL